MRQDRHEFSRVTKREALRRAGAGDVGNARCEAVGARYGLEPGKRCEAPLNNGVEFDHYPDPAGVTGSDTLENCVACCPACHNWKTRHYDVPMQAKDKRIRDRGAGIRPAPKLRSRGFDKREPQRTASRPIERTT